MKDVIKRPNRSSNDRLTVPERYNLMKELKTKALAGDMRAISAIGLFELAEANRQLNTALSRSGVAV